MEITSLVGDLVHQQLGGETLLCTRAGEDERCAPEWWYFTSKVPPHTANREYHIDAYNLELYSIGIKYIRITISLLWCMRYFHYCDGWGWMSCRLGGTFCSLLVIFSHDGWSGWGVYKIRVTSGFVSKVMLLGYLGVTGACKLQLSFRTWSNLDLYHSACQGCFLILVHLLTSCVTFFIIFHSRYIFHWHTWLFCRNT